MLSRPLTKHTFTFNLTHHTLSLARRHCVRVHVLVFVYMHSRVYTHSKSHTRSLLPVIIYRQLVQVHNLVPQPLLLLIIHRHNFPIITCHTVTFQLQLVHASIIMDSRSSNPPLGL